MFKKFVTPIILLLPAITLFETCSKSNGNLDNKNQPPVVVTDTTKTTAPIYSLVWSDEFDGPDIDTSKWNFETGNLSVNNEKEYYQKANASIQDGNLVITAKSEPTNGQPYTSARMNTMNKFSQTYGRIEARIKVPMGLGMWPAFWMLGTNITTVSWPKCGELDIMEHINNTPTIYGTMHWNLNGHVSYGSTTQSTPGDYHIYAIEWDQTEIRWYVDGTLYQTGNIKDNINGTDAFHLPFFIILNLAVAGDFPGQ
ncbi:MAG TPA: glycoside hydrolase family 16 protein, partial [Mucilaginibacter sp.]|nr:glycoside hydrolase family 16 protein [Mucilaginibacter sp.]